MASSHLEIGHRGIECDAALAGVAGGPRRVIVLRASDGISEASLEQESALGHTVGDRARQGPG